MIMKIREDAFSWMLGLMTLAGAAFIMTVMAIMVDNMSRIL